MIYMSFPILDYLHKVINPFIFDTCSILIIKISVVTIYNCDFKLFDTRPLWHGHHRISPLISTIQLRLERSVKVSESWFNQHGHPSVKSQLICRVRFVNRMDIQGHESRENLLRIDLSSRNHWIPPPHTATRSIMTCVHTISWKRFLFISGQKLGKKIERKKNFFQRHTSISMNAKI